jgi:hypothetical protein
MADFQFALPRIAVGAALTAADLPFLQSQGVSHIVDATQHDDSSFLQAPGFKVLFGNVADDGLPKDEWFERLAPWFLGEWASPHARFLFHCDAGCNRGPSSAYMAMRLLGFPRVLAVHLLRHARPLLLVNPLCIRYADDADRALATLGYA